MTVTTGSQAAVLVPIPGLYSTGVDNQGVTLPNGAAELHYVFPTVDSVPTVAGPNGALVATSSRSIRVFTQPNPGTPTSYAGNSATSAFIGPNNTPANASPVGNYYYSTFFTISQNYDINTASVTFRLFGDDVVADYFLNVKDFGRSNADPNGTDPQYPFQYGTLVTISAADYIGSNEPNPFRYGLNYLKFRVDNGFDASTGGLSQTALRVDLTSSILAVPEPLSLSLLAVGLVGAAVVRRGGKRAC